MTTYFARRLSTGEIRTLEVSTNDDGRTWMRDRKADPNGYGDHMQLADDSPRSVLDALSNEFELVEQDGATNA